MEVLPSHFTARETEAPGYLATHSCKSSEVLEPGEHRGEEEDSMYYCVILGKLLSLPVISRMGVRVAPTSLVVEKMKCINTYKAL